jgi:AmiR/NasT family two-component response regulator
MDDHELQATIDRWEHTGLFEPAEVHQAVGMMIQRFDITAFEALARLRDHAVHTRRRLIDVADEYIVNRPKC